MKVRYLTVPEVLFIHSAVIEETGGSHGVRDIGLLESAVRQIEQTFGGADLYVSVTEKAAHLFIGLLKNHPFVDGNKRTAISTTGVFLELNGLPLKVDSDRLAQWVEACAAGKPPITSVEKWFKNHSIRGKL